jgi:taurine dioxygenase
VDQQGWDICRCGADTVVERQINEGGLMTDTVTESGASPEAEVLATKDPGQHFGVRRHNLPDSIVQVGPVTQLAAERERLAALEWNAFSVTPLGSTIGAELSGVDLRDDLSDDVIAEIRQALFEYKVIFFRDQPLDPDQHVRFAARFGELEVHPFIPSNTGRPELVRFEKSAETGGYENLWHHDVTWREAPSMGAVLHAVEVPPVGGDTLFCDMYAAYEGLDDETKERIEGRTAMHDFLRAFGAQVPPERMEEMRELYPMVEHPIVVTHADTGRRHLYVNRVFTSHIVGMDQAESNQLLDLLCYQAETVEYQVRFTWRNDSIAFWDNRGAQHYASSDYWPQRRVMERASVVGGRPLA